MKNGQIATANAIFPDDDYKQEIVKWINDNNGNISCINTIFDLQTPETYIPYGALGQPDADDLIELFEKSSFEYQPYLTCYPMGFLLEMPEEGDLEQEITAGTEIAWTYDPNKSHEENAKDCISAHSRYSFNWAPEFNLPQVA